MCGIVGFVEPAGQGRAELLRSAARSILHRGPDEDGFHEEPAIAMGMRRLSIQDVVHGHQPVFSEDRHVVATMNGEIYNVGELQHLLQARGHVLASASDTELIPHLYEEFGLDFVDHLRGMFAIALWDARREQLLLVRDRVGKKPLYYWARGEMLSYASELKALLVDPRLPREADAEAISHYLSYTYVPAPLSAVRGVRKVPPAHMLVWRAGRSELRRYWTLEFAPEGTTRPESDRELADELRRRLVDCVRVRMIGERPVGAFLSGGLDSSAVVAAMREAGVADLKTFSIGFAADEFNELPHARRVANRYGTDHHELVVEPDVSDMLPRVATMFDEPYADSSAIPTWFLADLARKNVVVALSGDGGDEALGGYHRFAISMNSPQLRIPGAAARGLQRAGVAMRRRSSGAGVIDKAAKAALMYGDTTAARRYARFVAYFRHEDKLAVASPEFARVVTGHDSSQIIERLWDEHRDTDLANRLMAIDTLSYLPGDLLPKVDITTMNVSLEARSPFLDHTFLEWAASIPGPRKIVDGSKKHLLKLALQGWLDDDLIHRNKMGFGIPLADWLRGPLRDMAYDLLTDQTATSRGYFDARAVRQILDAHMSGEDRLTHVYPLMMLELWHRQVLTDVGL